MWSFYCISHQRHKSSALFCKKQIYGITWILEEENGDVNPCYAPTSESSFQPYRWAIRNFSTFANAAMFICATQSFYETPAYALRGGSSTLNTVDYHKHIVCFPQTLEMHSLQAANESKVLRQSITSLLLFKFVTQYWAFLILHFVTCPICVHMKQRFC